MVTLVGTQTEFLNAINALIELDYDAVEAYQAALARLKSEFYKEKLAEFLADHERHIQELSELIMAHGNTPPTGPDIKQHLLKGKVIAASMLGDQAILKAMKDNEVDTNTAYERMNHHAGKWPGTLDVLKRGWEDEQRHKAWLEATA